MIHLALVVAAALFLFCVACGAILTIIKMFQVHVVLGMAGIGGAIIGTFLILALV